MGVSGTAMIAPEERACQTTNKDYWIAKIGRNAARDRKSLAELADAGWAALVLWECELGEGLDERLRAFLD